MPSSSISSAAAHPAQDADEQTIRVLRHQEATSRPAGGERFLKRLEKRLGQVLRRQKPGRKRKIPGK